ncbi:MAG TPA: hypothetical protein VHM28_01355, partial [Anaerolineales bacterium]|nr:hypothetical protein [Anaerolineales bacterium]
MKFLFSFPSSDDLISLLKAWRFWLAGALVGALIAAAIYYIAPPPYRAAATVNVDFHLEQAWPQETDRQQFYYLERETRKLEELTMSDAVLNSVAAQVEGVTVEQMRAGALQLSQPGNGGWHFYADDKDPQKAAALASAWAQAFAEAVNAEIAKPSSTLEQYITADPTQIKSLTADRSLDLSIYLLAGSVV